MGLWLGIAACLITGNELRISIITGVLISVLAIIFEKWIWKL
jgi:type IV secretory pathway TrbD component